MAHYFFSRRARHKKRFTHNPSTTTRYCRVDSFATVDTVALFTHAHQWVDSVMAQANGGDILCFVHGYNTEHPEMIERLEKIKKGLKATGRFNGTVIGYDWPSDGRTLLALATPDKQKRLSYNADREESKRASPFLISEGLAMFLDRLGPGQRLHVLGHSMGARVVTRGLERSSDVFGIDWRLGEMVFTAADIDAAEMERGNSYALTVERRSDRVTNYHSLFDDTLDLGKQFVNGGRDRLGRAGLPLLRTDHLHDVNCTDFYSDNYRTFADIVKSHTWYFDDDAFYADLVKVLTGRAQTKERALRS
ncbi:MAG: alpha/beta fold hydrolase [Pseudomonadota bacterium]